MKVRSFKYCPFDGNVIEIDVPNTNRTRLLGISELCIPNKENNILYCFPDMLYHYITHHQYLSPLELKAYLLYAFLCFDGWRYGFLMRGLELPQMVYKSASNAPLMSSVSAWLMALLPCLP